MFYTLYMFYIYKYLILIKRISLLLILTFAAIGYLSIQNVTDDDSQLLFSSKLISKSIVMNFLHKTKSMVDKDYIPTPFDDENFKYADLDSPRFSNILTQDSLTPFFEYSSVNGKFENAIDTMDILRSNMTVGSSSKDWSKSNVAEMFAAGLNGESYLCGDIAKMFIVLVQSKGFHARKIGLNRSDGIGHVVVEVYNPTSQKWVLFDPTNNIYYKFDNKILNAIELMRLIKDNNKIKIIRGKNNSEIITANRYEELLDFYKHGIVVEFYDKWVEMNADRFNPIRSPSIMGIYVGNDLVRKIYYRHDLPPEDYENNRRKLYEAT